MVPSLLRGALKLLLNWPNWNTGDTLGLFKVIQIACGKINKVERKDVEISPSAPGKARWKGR